MSLIDGLIENLPEVTGPTQKKLSFKEKLKWTGIVLVLFFILGMIPLFGLGHNALSQFEYLSTVLAANFGSLISLGIGPIVTASIILQLLNGSGIINMDLTTHEGKKRFQGIQKLLAIILIVVEAFIFVFMGGLAPDPGLIGQSVYLTLRLLLVFQLCLGGLMLLFMDEVVSKWGFGSGISLFIAAGVSQTIFIRALSPLPSPLNPGVATGAIPALFQSLSAGDPTTAGLMLAAVISTIVVFMIAVYAQAMKIEIPLSFGRIRGYGIRWPLSFMYTGVIPVILVSALMANIQLFARFLQNWGYPILGTFNSQGGPQSGIVAWLHSPDLVGSIIRGNVTSTHFIQAGIYMFFMIAGCVIFSIFWVQASGMDARSQAKQIMSSGLQIPGFRKDQRILEHLLNRYIHPLTIMGGIAIGFLASIADLIGALSSGTGILLTVMIIYKLYEEISKQHMMDMNPMMRKFMGGS